MRNKGSSTGHPKPLTCPYPDDEAHRLEALNTLGLLSPDREDAMERAARLAAHVTGVPYGGFSLVGETHQWFKASHDVPYEIMPREQSFCAWTILSAAPLVIPDASQDPRFCTAAVVAGAPNIRFYAGVPIRDLAGFPVGALCVLDLVPRTLDAARIAALTDVAALLEHALWLKALAVLDPLTGLYNRRFFDQYAAGEWRRARRSRAPISVLLADLDHFGRYNAALGHQAGDRALCAVARVLRSSARRGGDLVARYGGEEFVMVLPETDQAGAQEVAERLRSEILALGLAHPDSPAGPNLTVSLGVTTMNQGDGRDLHQLLKDADAALFVAKNAGRNRTHTG